jgi:hypothetical protein
VAARVVQEPGVVVGSCSVIVRAEYKGAIETAVSGRGAIGLAVARPGADLALPALRVPLTVGIAETGEIDKNERKEKGEPPE